MNYDITHVEAETIHSDHARQIEMFQDDILDMAIMQLYVRGITSPSMISQYLQLEVTKLLGNKVNTIHYERSPDIIKQRIKRIRESWANETKDARDILRRVEIEKLNHVETEAWLAWNESKKPALKDIIANESDKSRQEYTHSVGNPRFLEIIKRTSDQRSKILGLFAADEREEKRDDNKTRLKEQLERKLGGAGQIENEGPSNDDVTAGQPTESDG